MHTKTTKRLSHPAPRRATRKAPGGGFYSVPYTEAAVLSTLASGGWFNFGTAEGHDFENKRARVFAGDAQLTQMELLREAA